MYVKPRDGMKKRITVNKTPMILMAENILNNRHCTYLHVCFMNKTHHVASLLDFTVIQTNYNNMFYRPSFEKLILLYKKKMLFTIKNHYLSIKKTAITH